jgi:hypothetical protein
MGRIFKGEIRHCLVCNIEIKVPLSALNRGKGKYCSKECFVKATVHELKCLICSTPFITHKCKIENSKGKFCSKKCFFVSKIGSFTGDKNPNWKDNNVQYRALHSWVKRQKGSPSTCEHCGNCNLKPRQYNWANKSHKYLRDINDWIRLCGKCHKKYDRK